MSTIAAKLKNVIKCKNAIRTAINNKGGHVTENSEFSDYVAAINNLTSNEGSVDIMKPVYITQKAPVTKVGQLEKIFFDTSLTTEQVDSIIANANLEFSVISDDVTGLQFYPILTTQQIMLIIIDHSPNLDLESGSACAIGVLDTDIVYYVSSALAESFPNTLHAGWNKDAFTNYDTGEVNFGTDLAQEEGGFNVGAQNNLITDLVYIPTLVDSGEVELAKNLTGHYKLVEKDITLDAEIDTDYTYGFENSVDEDTKEISIIKKIKVINDKESKIIDKTITAYTNNTVEKIGPYAFAFCQSLTDANFPNVRDIGEQAFYNCRSLTNIDAPLVTSINEQAFYNCRSLTNIDAPLVTSINELAFYDCDSLVDISLPQVAYISSKAFDDCDSLTSINLPQVKSVGNRAFYYCRSLTNIDIPQVVSIGTEAFYRCYSLANISLPQVTSLPSSAFYSCDSLTNIDIPLVTSIGTDAFYNCDSLVDISLPLVTSIGNGAFSSCGSLTNIAIPLVTSIGTEAFANCYSLANISLPQVTSLPSSAFSNCDSLTSISLPQVTSVGLGAFANCYSLANISLPQVTSVGNSAFDYCNSLTNIDIPLVTSVGKKAFYACTSLIKVFISQKDNVCSLYSYAFDGCYHILGTKNTTYNPEGLKDGYIYVPASLLSQYKVATNWSAVASQIIGHEDLEAGATLPNYTTDTFTTQTWYSDERLTTVVTEVATSGTYYCRLEN